jgi:hypothetical protein
MKGFFKFLGAVAAFFAAVFGAIFVFDRISNKNAINDEYLDCTAGTPEDK